MVNAPTNCGGPLVETALALNSLVSPVVASVAVAEKLPPARLLAVRKAKVPLPPASVLRFAWPR